ncbi:hypothetical protein [Pseudaestuariivita sp.]|uniref:hypothetical protein n=1 Tax=Pseudaestuariivita sp. TaxID=2211669 RepID=UPI004059CE88
MNILFIASVTGAQFFRAGMRFVKEGALHDVSDWAEDKLERIVNDPNLKVRPPTDAELEAAAAADGAVEVDPALHDELMKAIPQLPPGAFKGDGQPKLPNVRSAVLEADPKQITAETVKAAMDALVEGGFKVPAAPT